MYRVKWWTGTDVSAGQGFSICTIKVAENGSIRPAFISNIRVYVADCFVSLPGKSRQAAIDVTVQDRDRNLNILIELTS